MRAAARIVEREKIDAVIVSARRFPHLTSISDFRHDWVGFDLIKPDPPEPGSRIRLQSRGIRSHPRERLSGDGHSHHARVHPEPFSG